MDQFAALAAFVRSVELGSFSKAAAESGAKVSTISRHVAMLEADLGAALFNRSTRRLVTTEAGLMLFERAMAILGDLEEARSQVRSLNAEPQGVLRLNAPGAFGRRHIVPLLPEFLSGQPKVRINLALTDDIVDLLATRTDLAIRIGVLADSRLVARRLAPQERMVVASPEWVRGHGRPTHPEDLGRMPCLRSATQAHASWYYRPVAAADQEWQEAALSDSGLCSNDSEVILTLCEAACGAALLPSWLINTPLRDGRLIRLLPTWHWAISPGPAPAVWGVYPPKRIVSSKVRTFLDFLAGKLGSPLWDGRRQ